MDDLKQSKTAISNIRKRIVFYSIGVLFFALLGYLLGINCIKLFYSSYLDDDKTSGYFLFNAFKVSLILGGSGIFSLLVLFKRILYLKYLRYFFLLIPIFSALFILFIGISQLFFQNNLYPHLRIVNVYFMVQSISSLFCYLYMLFILNKYLPKDKNRTEILDDKSQILK